MQSISTVGLPVMDMTTDILFILEVAGGRVALNNPDCYSIIDGDKVECGLPETDPCLPQCLIQDKWWLWLSIAFLIWSFRCQAVWSARTYQFFCWRPFQDEAVKPADEEDGMAIGTWTNVIASWFPCCTPVGTTIRMIDYVCFTCGGENSNLSGCHCHLTCCGENKCSCWQIVIYGYLLGLGMDIVFLVYGVTFMPFLMIWFWIDDTIEIWKGKKIKRSVYTIFLESICESLPQFIIQTRIFTVSCYGLDDTFGECKQSTKTLYYLSAATSCFAIFKGMTVFMYYNCCLDGGAHFYDKEYATVDSDYKHQGCCKLARFQSIVDKAHEDSEAGGTSI